MPPIIAFFIGLLGVRLIEFGIVVTAKRNVKSYFDGEIAGRWITLAGSSLLVVVAWQLQALDKLVTLLPDGLAGDWASSGIPFTPQVGLIMGALLSFRGVHRITAAFKKEQPVEPVP